MTRLLLYSKPGLPDLDATPCFRKEAYGQLSCYYVTALILRTSKRDKKEEEGIVMG